MYYQINCSFLPSLKRLVLVKVAITMWNQKDVRRSISNKFSYDHGINENEWEVIENRVIQKVLKLQLPGKLKSILISYIRPVGFQIANWLKFHIIEYEIPIRKLPREFFWTPRGSIDGKKVAETLMNDERLDDYARYKLACIYCLEEHIMLLSKKLRVNFYTDSAKAIVSCWSYYIVGKIDKLYHLDPRLERHTAEYVAFSTAGFHISVDTGNEAGTRYFLQRFASEDRAKLFVEGAATLCVNRKSKIIENSYFSAYGFSNNLCYLLSELNVNEQTALASVYASDILHYLLCWPWQDTFLRTAEEIWESLSAKDYYSLLKAINTRFYLGWKDFDYQNLFGVMWQQGSYAFKRHVIMNKGLVSLASLILPVTDAESIKFTFKLATMLEKEEFLFSYEGLEICCYLIQVGNWELLKFYIQECISSKEKLQEIFLHLYSYFDTTVKEEIDLLNKFLQILYGCFEKKPYNSS